MEWHKAVGGAPITTKYSIPGVWQWTVGTAGDGGTAGGGGGGGSVPMIALTVAFWASVFAGIVWVAYRL